MGGGRRKEALLGPRRVGGEDVAARWQEEFVGPRPKRGCGWRRAERGGDPAPVLSPSRAEAGLCVICGPC